MGTTSNYNWPYPEATGLVKDGWEDIKDLATAIDTTAASTFTGGLILLQTINPSAVASINFNNNVFSATYDRYLLVGTYEQNSVVGGLNLRGRTGGTSNSGNNYCLQNMTASSTSVGAGRASSTSGWEIMYQGGGYISIKAQLFNMFNNDTKKAVIAEGTKYTNTSSIQLQHTVTGWVGSAVSFDSLEVLTTAGSMTGQFSLYAIKD